MIQGLTKTTCITVSSLQKTVRHATLVFLRYRTQRQMHVVLRRKQEMHNESITKNWTLCLFAPCRKAERPECRPTVLTKPCHTAK